MERVRDARKGPVTVGGGDHGVHPSHDACVVAYVEGFLVDGRMPTEDAWCEGEPLTGLPACR
ncbi:MULTISPECIES: alpha/beta hydrolase [unclassified Streptomyces]|uniref:alpha/beta hydrolase n=1 Tax=unclassified Streptomyces TaxID=2593676 RepID=UPI000D1202CD|nr:MULTISPECIES: alpha/beta hydrolase [unclassified Streptomyces]